MYSNFLIEHNRKLPIRSTIVYGELSMRFWYFLRIYNTRYNNGKFVEKSKDSFCGKVKYNFVLSQLFECKPLYVYIYILSWSIILRWKSAYIIKYLGARGKQRLAKSKLQCNYVSALVPRSRYSFHPYYIIIVTAIKV